MPDDFGVVVVRLLEYSGRTTAKEFLFSQQLLMNFEPALESEGAVRIRRRLSSRQVAHFLLCTIVVVGWIEAVIHMRESIPKRRLRGKDVGRNFEAPKLVSRLFLHRTKS